jgi:hypothetical protein
MKTTTKLSAMILAGCATLTAHAQPLANGGFESGLLGWTATGDASLQGGAPEGSSQLWLTTASVVDQDDFPLAVGALNRSGTGAATVGAPGGVEEAAGLALGALDLPDAAAYEGSVVSRQVVASAGDVLSFRWNFGTNDSFADYAFFAVGGLLNVLADTSHASTPTSFLGNSFETGLATFSYTFLSSGTHHIAFGVVDVGDFGVTSTLAIDDVQIAAVPEPTSLALLLAGGTALLARRRRARAASC